MSIRKQSVWMACLLSLLISTFGCSDDSDSSEKGDDAEIDTEEEIELQQAGIFEIAGYEGDEFGAIVGSFCPNILFPYARETIAGIIQKGGFPEFVLQPINFDALYMQAKQQAEEQGAKTEAH